MSKFKVGQKVRITKTTRQNGYDAGQIVTIDALASFDGDCYKLTGGTIRQGYAKDYQMVPEDCFEAYETYEESKPVLDLSKPIKTFGGETFELLTTEGRGNFPIVGYVGERDFTMHFNAEGIPSSNHPAFKLVNVKPKPLEREMWVNVYSYETGELVMGCSWDSRAEADAGGTSNRVGCIKVKLAEGVFDN